MTPSYEISQFPYLAAVAAAAVDLRRQGNDRVAIYVIPAASTESGEVPGALNKTLPVNDVLLVMTHVYSHDRSDAFPKQRPQERAMPQPSKGRSTERRGWQRSGSC